MNRTVKTVTLILGTAFGAFLGYRMAQSFIKESESAQSQLPITASQGLKLGLTALGVFKQFSKISKDRS
ncbi:MAG: hypothetical protein VB108_09885 [Anaerolineaceae bacterium]|nr:hypothetical protein [Anaerolineaceae bacterium]